MKIGIATSKDIPFFTESDKIALKIFTDNKIEIIPVVWDNKNIIWEEFDLIIIRSVWDYYLKIELFFEWLDLLEKLKIKTYNSINTVKKNSHKFYLKNLIENGIDVIPTVFVPKTEILKLNYPILSEWNKIIIKPAISACSYLTEVFEIKEKDSIEKKYSSFSKSNDLLVQKFMPEIQKTGEISLVFFNKKYSHAIVKEPVNGDFRVQYQYGGKYRKFEPKEEILNICNKILCLYKEDLLFARIDGVNANNKFYIMEIELIEPDLYFNYDEKAKFNFYEAFKKYAGF